MKPSGIGGQAVMEGVMMKNGKKYAVAVRKPDKEICVEVKETKSIADRMPLFKLPILRGMAAFVESMSLGMSSLTFSASFYEEEEEESKFEKKLNKLTKGHADSVFNALTVVIAVLLAVGIFVALPMFLASILSEQIESQMVLSIFEGVLRVVIFVLYILLISLMKDIKRLFMYHGAEHKAINCIEHGHALTVANVRKQSKEHKRCGTSFMLTVLIISIIFFMFIRIEHAALRLVVRLLLIPIIAGVSYEFIRFAGRHDNVVINILSRPGMWLQALTTREPDDEMIEVAIQSVEAVFDWKSFIESGKKKSGKNQGKKKSKPEPKKAQTESVKQAPKAEAKAQEQPKSEQPKEKKAKDKKVKEEPKVVATETASAPETEAAVAAEEISATEEAKVEKPLEIDISKLFDIKLDTASVGSAKPKTAPKKDPIPSATKAVSAMNNNEEDDDILKALDMYFEFNGPKSVMEISDEEPDEDTEG